MPRKLTKKKGRQNDSQHPRFPCLMFGDSYFSKSVESPGTCIFLYLFIPHIRVEFLIPGPKPSQLILWQPRDCVFNFFDDTFHERLPVDRAYQTGGLRFVRVAPHCEVSRHIYSNKIRLAQIFVESVEDRDEQVVQKGGGRISVGMEAVCVWFSRRLWWW